MSAEFRIDPKYRDWLVPIWSQERGERLKWARMKRMYDQRELGAMLGISQQEVSKVENGRLRFVDVSVRKLITVFADSVFLYIMTGQGAAGYNIEKIKAEYKDYRFRIHRANRTQKLTGKEQKLLADHAKRVMGEPADSAETDKGDYVARRK